jgi:ADP-ribosyl-[dinitrogen reductase] hydrolase
MMKKKEAAYVEPGFVLPSNQLTAEEIARVLTFPDGLAFFEPDAVNRPRDALRTYSLVSSNDEDAERARAAVAGGTWSEQSVLGCLLGNVCGDALGAPMEFKPVVYGSTTLTDMGDACWNSSRFFLKPGQWTDDASMALCAVDSLLVHGSFAAPGALQDLRLRFLCWWELGLNNAFQRDEERRGGGSVGLGGNISMSFPDFRRNKGAATEAGDRNTSGNGSVMRNAAVCCAFWDDSATAMEQAALQSRTTHQGVEAAECCRLMAWLCSKAAQEKPHNVREFLERVAAEFETPEYSVSWLARSAAEERRPSNEKFELEDRNWNWRDADYRYSPLRAKQMPGYVGSYAMDALAMALHCIHSTDSFRAALLKCGNLCGDADSVAAVCGQIAGAIYGSSQIPANWIALVENWAGDTIALRAYKLHHHKRVTPPSVAAIDHALRMDREFFESTVTLAKKTNKQK